MHIDYRAVAWPTFTLPAGVLFARRPVIPVMSGSNGNSSSSQGIPSPAIVPQAQPSSSSSHSHTPTSSAPWSLTYRQKTTWDSLPKTGVFLRVCFFARKVCNKDIDNFAGEVMETKLNYAWGSHLLYCTVNHCWTELHLLLCKKTQYQWF